MINKMDCINYELLKEFDIVHIPKSHFPLGPVSFSTNLPPDYPLYWAEWYPQEDMAVMKDLNGNYRLIKDNFMAWRLRKPLPLDHPAVQAFIERIKIDNEGTFIHPVHGVFRLDFFDQDLVKYNATDIEDPEKVVEPPTKEELEPFAVPENAYYIQVVKRHYPEYTP